MAELGVHPAQFDRRTRRAEAVRIGLEGTISTGRECNEHQLPGPHSEQRRSRLEPHPAARAGALAAGVLEVVGRARPERFSGGRRVPAHRDLGGRQGLGDLRLCAHAGVPLGHLPERARSQPPHRLRRQLRPGGVAADSRRIPRDVAAADRHAGRHRAGLGRAAAHARAHRALALRPAQLVPGKRGRRPPPVGDGVPAARLLRTRRPRRSRGVAGAPLRRRRQAAHSWYLQRADPRLAQLFHVHLLHRPRRQIPA